MAAAPAAEPGFLVGAATTDFTPPAFRDVPGCMGSSPIFTGPRQFAFIEPYIDLHHRGHYDAGDPFLDCDGNGRWDGNLLGGGSSTPRFFSRVADPVGARAIAVRSGARTLVIVVVDQEGLFNVYQQEIRARAARLAGISPDDIFISATHDESAPDSLGLGGINQVTSGTNPYFVEYLISRSALAVRDAVRAVRPARIRFAEAIEPANLRQCWSSYPYVDDQLMPTMQAVGTDGRVIATLASVSQHAETLGFNHDPVAATWISSDWPHFFRAGLEQRYGGVAVEMAGSVGSNETPQVFTAAVSRVPQRFIAASHPAGCSTLFAAPGTPEPTGYLTETRDLGLSLADAVAAGLEHATWSQSTVLWGARTDVCIPLRNLLFAVGAVAGVFAARPGYPPLCVGPGLVAPTGTTVGTSLRTEVAAFRVGDGTFASVPGEVFPFTYLGSFLGPSDLPYPGQPRPPLLFAHMRTPYRFIDGLAEDMVGYIFPAGNAVGIPGEHPLDNQLGTSDRDRFGCGHSDDSESAGSDTGQLLGDALVGLLGPSEPAAVGRYVLPNGRLSRDPLGSPGSIKCDVDTTFAAAGAAVAVSVGGSLIHPAQWMSLSGRPQATPDRNTRGWIDAAGGRHWLDVYPDSA